MSYIAHDIRTYDFTSKDKLFFDANVWVLIHGPFIDSARLRHYSNAVSKALKAECSVYVDAIILSEFANRYARIEQKNSETASENFKAYRNSAEFKRVAPRIADGVARILEMCQVVESGFTAIDTTAFIDRLESGDYDFNDIVIAELCRTQNYILVTDDGDCRNFDIEVLTINAALLK